MCSWPPPNTDLSSGGPWGQVRSNSQNPLPHRSQVVRAGAGCVSREVRKEKVSSFLGDCPAAGTGAWKAEPSTRFFPAAARFHLWFCSLHADDNSNQSSIADASPIKQENSSNSSPAPEPNSSMPGDGADTKADEAQAEGKELPGAEGMCPWGPGLRGASLSPSILQSGRQLTGL